jgi:hypothetical protein
MRSITRGLLSTMCLLALLAVGDETPAQQKNTAVSRAQSSVLLDMPGLERGGVERFHYFGWDSSYASETSLALVTAPGDGFPAATAVMQQLGKNWIWRAATLDESWIRQTAFPLKDRPITVTRPGRIGSDGYLNTVLFSSGNVNCVGFDFRRYAKGIVDATGGEVGYRGFYCGAPGDRIGEDQIARIVAGIYVRDRGTIRRAYELDASPIPDHLLR